MPDAGRFPRPWTVHHSDEAFWVESANGMRFGYSYYDNSPARGGVIRPHILTEDDARRLVTNFAKLGAGAGRG